MSMIDFVSYEFQHGLEKAVAIMNRNELYRSLGNHRLGVFMLVLYTSDEKGVTNFL